MNKENNKQALSLINETRSQSDIVITLILQIATAIYILYALCGCSVQFEIGYHGKTGRDDQKVTESFKSVKTERY